MRKEPIYLDYAATTYVKDEVLEAMLPYFKEHFGNPAALYTSGREANRILGQARESTAKHIGARRSSEIYFTSGGTESDNWALKGIMAAAPAERRHLIVSAIEHHAVLESARFLEKAGYSVSYAMPDRDGIVWEYEIERLIRPDTALISVCYVNNETGVINPIKAIAETAKRHSVLFHTDAVQAAGHLKLNAEEIGADALSISAHKFYGPKGVGVLYLKEGTPIKRWMDGGAQEKKQRAGTQNVASAVGLAKALELSDRTFAERVKKETELRDYMIRQFIRHIPGIVLNGHPTKRICSNVNISVKGLNAQLALAALDLAGIECSSGSACTAGLSAPSHVLTAMGAAPRRAREALRFTLNEETAVSQIDDTAAELKKIAERARESVNYEEPY